MNSTFETTQTIEVIVRDTKTGNTMKRLFNFACTENEMAGVGAPVSSTSQRSERTYDLLGRSHEKAQPGLNIQRGRKFLSR